VTVPVPSCEPLVRSIPPTVALLRIESEICEESPRNHTTALSFPSR
jgi:hypothetical protein